MFEETSTEFGSGENFAIARDVEGKVRPEESQGAHVPGTTALKRRAVRPDVLRKSRPKGCGSG
jgi:hypothetical protein